MFRVILNDAQLLNEEHRHLRRARDATAVAVAVTGFAICKLVGELNDADAGLASACLELHDIHGLGGDAWHGEPNSVHETVLPPLSARTVHTALDWHAH
jgi:hypothetical protein